jgi:hypothetical protein
MNHPKNLSELRIKKAVLRGEINQREQRMRGNYNYAKKNIGWIFLSNIFSNSKSKGYSSPFAASDILKGIIPGILGSERLPAWLKWLAGFFESLWNKFGNPHKQTPSDNV